MLTSQTFLKKTKRGNILKIVREHYLREDIWCGSELCVSCRQTPTNSTLETSPESLSNLVGSHYLILDTNVVLDQIDVLEEDVLKNVIVLQTVLKEVKHKSSSIYKRLEDIISNVDRRFYTFVNEHHKETYIERNYGEKINDRNDRAIRKCAVWYKSHLNNQISIVLLTDDYDNREKAKNEGVQAFSVEEYVKSLGNHPTLIDKISRRQCDSETVSGGESLFPPHYTPFQIHEGVKNQSLLIGSFQASKENYLEGSVNVEEKDLSILVQGRAGLNRAVDGDTVAVKLLPENEWVGSSDLVLQDNEEEDINIEEKIVIEKAKQTVEKKPTGVIVGIVKRKWRQYCGVLQQNPIKGSVKHLFVPAERKIPKVRIETRQNDILCQQRIIVAIDSWPRHSWYPLGHFVRALGPIGDKNTENEVLLLEHDVPHSKFSEAVLSFLPSLPWKIEDHFWSVILRVAFGRCSKRFANLTAVGTCSGDSVAGYSKTNLGTSLLCALTGFGKVKAKDRPKRFRILNGPDRIMTQGRGFLIQWVRMKSRYWVRLLLLPTKTEIQKRVDLRHLDICSVDPPGCTDIDDALHCRSLENGNFEVGVHIADVTHFIRPGNALDKEAALRGTTVYLIDKRIDMVPELLSSNLCSLRDNEERLTFSCIWEMTKKAEIVSTKFHKSIIKSRSAMTYEQAQLKIDDKSQKDVLAVALRNLNSLAKILKKRRMENGALVLASPEIRFQVDSETLDPLKVETKEMRETNSMVEEFMLLANISVAEKILKDFPECALLRRHPQPPLSNFEPLVKAGAAQGFEMNVDSGKNLANSLDSAIKPNNPYFNTMLRILATRCMLQAVYFPSGMLQPNDYFHYGLACPIYTHFTSPIRRYADIIVHRLLAVAIGADSTYPDLLDKRKTNDLCRNLNYRHRMAQYAGRASVALHTHLFFRGKIQDEEGYILYVRKNALQILIPKYGLEGVLYVSGRKELDEIGFVYDETKQTQKCGDIFFNAFDPVTVQVSLDRSNVQHEKLVLQLVYPEVPNFSVPSQTGKRKNEEVGKIEKKSHKKK